MPRKRKGSPGLRCPCEKVCFSYEGAETALLNAKIARALRHSQKRKEIRIYGDCWCGHWHLTSKEDLYWNMHTVRGTSPDDSAGPERKEMTTVQPPGTEFDRALKRWTDQSEK